MSGSLNKRGQKNSSPIFVNNFKANSVDSRHSLKIGMDWAWTEVTKTVIQVEN